MTATEIEERIKAMAAVKHYGNGSAGVGQQRSEPKWERTPWWVFWRPYWRRLNSNYWNTTGRYEYRTKRQLAHEFLREKFDDKADTSPSTNHRGKAINSRAWTGR